MELATHRNHSDRVDMQLTLIGRDPASNPDGSPTVYRTDRDSWIVQGWVVSDAEALGQIDLPDGGGVCRDPRQADPVLPEGPVTSISDDEFGRLVYGFEREAVHLETRDAYGTEVELPHMAQWAAGEPDDLSWMQGWCAMLRDHVGVGRTVRRARASEPLSDYQRWSYSIAHPMIDAGEDIRWVPRRLTSSICLPGNDFLSPRRPADHLPALCRQRPGRRQGHLDGPRGHSAVPVGVRCSLGPVHTPP